MVVLLLPLLFENNMCTTELIFHVPCFVHTIVGAVEATPRIYPPIPTPTTASSSTSTRSAYDSDNVLDLTGLNLTYQMLTVLFDYVLFDYVASAALISFVYFYTTPTAILPLLFFIFYSYLQRM